MPAHNEEQRLPRTLEEVSAFVQAQNYPVEVVLVENYQGLSATDAYGIAEPSNIPTAPAIANAFYNAVGVRVRTLPMTPAAVLRAALGEVASELLGSARIVPAKLTEAGFRFDHLDISAALNAMLAR